MVVVEALKEKALSSLVRELWTLRTMLVRAQKEMRNMLTYYSGNQHTPLAGTLQFYPEAIHDPSEGTTINHRYYIPLIHFNFHLKLIMNYFHHTKEYLKHTYIVHTHTYAHIYKTTFKNICVYIYIYTHIYIYFCLLTFPFFFTIYNHYLAFLGYHNLNKYK